MPKYARDELGLFGINLPTDLLAGAGRQELERFREAADKASCPCLVLVESEAQPFASPSDREADGAIQRMLRVVEAAHRLGCNAAAVALSGSSADEAYTLAAERLRDVLVMAERLEVNLLLADAPGVSEDPDRLTELIKRVGGFRIGTFPDFLSASKTKDPVHYLRRLTPYAAALVVTTSEFSEDKGSPTGYAHAAYDINAFAESIQSVGYQGTIAIDYQGGGDIDRGVVLTRQALEEALGIVTES